MLNMPVLFFAEDFRFAAFFLRAGALRVVAFFRVVFFALAFLRAGFFAVLFRAGFLLTLAFLRAGFRAADFRRGLLALRAGALRRLAAILIITSFL